MHNIRNVFFPAAKAQLTSDSVFYFWCFKADGVRQGGGTCDCCSQISSDLCYTLLDYT